MKRGFTIVEMLIVISVIGVLMGIVTTAARNSVRDARDRRRLTMATVLEQGMSTFYAKAGQWPQALEDIVRKGQFGTNDTDWYELSEDEVDKCFQEIAKCSTKTRNPVMDVTGLFVAPKSAKRGMDFNVARNGRKKNDMRLSVDKMVFGYPEKDSGKFIRYKMKYSIPGDTVKVY